MDIRCASETRRGPGYNQAMVSKREVTSILLAVVLLALSPAFAAAQAVGGNRPFVGFWKLNFEKSHLRAAPGVAGVYRKYEDHGDGWMFHTVINMTRDGSDFLFTAARYDGKQYPVYNGESLGSFLSKGTKTQRTVAFTRISAYKFLWTDRMKGRVVEGGICTVSADGKTLTITDEARGRKTRFVQVFDRQR